jgi:acetolactate synthase regulatory subunit
VYHYKIVIKTGGFKMLVVMNTNATEQDIERVIRCIESKGFEARVCHGETKSVVHAIGIQEADKRDLKLLNGVFEVLKSLQIIGLHLVLFNKMTLL